MNCYKPFKIISHSWNEKGWFYLPCGKCIACQNVKALEKKGISRHDYIKYSLKCQGMAL